MSSWNSPSITANVSDVDAQRLRQHAGKVLEQNVAFIITQLLQREDIYAVSLKELIELSKREEAFRQVLEFAKMPLRCPCDQTFVSILPDTDVIVYYTQKDHQGHVLKRYHLATISCKVSFHGRHTESTFWASQMKGGLGAKFVLVTEDKKKPAGELGICDKGNQTRRLLEHYMDSIYTINQYEGRANQLSRDIGDFYRVFEDSKQSGYLRQNTRIFDNKRPSDRYCQQVRPFDDLLFDLMEWKFKAGRM